ncbi:hypothetical protein R1sor_011685 [Riccia sorocarpa]|uniref:Neprosin PEP catalytic domain-containing protein n=1 Tax=Riccia sorocarpa TaxID=122646 RepID=A0ABD3I7Q8_9MARC
MENYLGTVLFFIFLWSSCLQLSESAEFGFAGRKYSRFDATANVVDAPASHHEFRGASATFSMWQPYVELPSEFSLAQIWITAGNYQDNSLNSIEVGWQVCEEIYGDNLPHLFVFWTRDAYNSTHCYKYAYLRDAGNEIWVLALDGENVGYWPASLFNLLNDGVATNVDWGGEIVNSEPDGRHTKTVMGSGQFAEAGLKSAAYIRSMKTRNLQNEEVAAPLDPNNRPFATKSSCYDVRRFSDPSSVWGTYIVYGGAGLSSKCQV